MTAEPKKKRGGVLSGELWQWSDAEVAKSLAVNLVGCLHVARSAEWLKDPEDVVPGSV